MIRTAWTNDKIRYLFIGGYNTVFGFGIFAALWLLWGEQIHYIGVLVLSHVLSVTNAFFAYRILVFRKKGEAYRDFVRFNMVYLGAFIFNLVALPVLIEEVGLHPLVAQGLLVVVTVVASYVLHRRYSFRIN